MRLGCTDSNSVPCPAPPCGPAGQHGASTSHIRRRSWPLPAQKDHHFIISHLWLQHSRGVGAELALKRVAVVCRDLGLGDQLSHLLPNATRQVPHIAVSLW